MKKLFFSVAVLISVLFASCDSKETVFTLSMENTGFEYDEQGIWTDLYNTKVSDIIVNNTLSFYHYASVLEYEYDGQAYQTTYYMGWSPCNNADADPNIPQSAITKGGVTGEGTPYMTCYWGDYYDDVLGQTIHTGDIKIINLAGCTLKHVYITNTAQVVSTILNGGQFGARKFTDGDYLKLTITALDRNENATGQIDYYLADFRNGKNFINQSWEKIDLTSLTGSELRFTMESSDSNQFGSLTPTYFALDQLTIVPYWEK